MADKPALPRQHPEMGTDALKQLEIEKLTLELERLRCPWWKDFLVPSSWTEAAAVMVAVAAIVTGWWTGFFQAESSRIETQNERLTMQGIQLAEEQKSREEELRTIQAELASTKASLALYESERQAVLTIKRMVDEQSTRVRMSITLRDDLDTFAVELRPGGIPRIHFDWNAPVDHTGRLAGPPAGDEVISDRTISAVLVLLHDVKRMRELTIRNLVLTRADIDSIMSFPKLESLTLQSNLLTDDAFSPDGPMTTAATLCIIDNVGVTRLPAHRLVGLTELCLSGTGFDDAGVAGLVPLSPSMRTLSVQRSNVTDAGMTHLGAFRNLLAIDLQATQVSEAGIATLMDTSLTAIVLVSNAKVPEAALEGLNTTKRPALAVLPLPIVMDFNWVQGWADIRSRALKRD